MSGERRRRLLVLVLTIATILGAYCLTLATTKVTNDVTSASLTSWRIAHTGTPWLEEVHWQRYENPAPLWVGEAENGHVVAFRSPGPIAAAVPSYLAARLLGVDDYSMIPGSVTAALLTTLALALLYGAVHSRAGTRATVLSILALAFATPVWSVAADSLWTHPVTLLGIGGMAFACARERWWLVGLFGGVAIWGRLHTAVIVALLGLGLSLIRRQPRIALVVGSVSAASLALSFLWGRWMYGSWRPAGGYSVNAYTERAVSTESPWDQVLNHIGLWVAPDRGILIWTPALLLLLPALVRAWGRLPDWSRCLVVGGVVYTLIQGQLNGFSGGSSFYGYRLTLELLVCLFPALVMSLPHTGSVARVLLGPVLGLQLAAFSLGAAGDGGILGEGELWTNNSFVHIMGIYPALIAWPLLLALAGLLMGRRLARRSAPSTPAPHNAQPPSMVAATHPREPS